MFTVAAFLDIIFRPPLNIERFIYEHVSLDKLKSKEIKLPTLPKLDLYLKAVAGRKIFQSASRKENTEPQAVTNIQDYDFNGVVTLDKLYVAIFKKSTQEQFLASEGSTVDGITVKKIDRGFVIIEIYGEERKIVF